jgi:hypothetical protein
MDVGAQTRLPEELDHDDFECYPIQNEVTIFANTNDFFQEKKIKKAISNEHYIIIESLKKK